MKLVAVVLLVIASCSVVGCSSRMFGFGQLPEGPTITLQARPGTLPTDPVKRKDAMESALKVINNRIKGIQGVVEPTAELQGDDRILVHLPGIKNGKQAADVLTRSGSLDFYWLKNVRGERNRTAKWRMSPATVQGEGYVFTNAVNNKEINSQKNPEKVLQEVVNAYDPVKNPKGIKPVLTSADLQPNARADLSQSDGPIIRIELDEHGTRVFRDFTRSHIGEYLAIFYDGKILTAPVIRAAIPNGSAQISGFKSISEADDVAQSLNAGSLSVPLQVVAID